MKRAVVYLGPTLALGDAQAQLEAMYLPPVAQGDIIRALRTSEPPFAIGIIDGYFERVPAVWHKELLWALSQGVHVFGAASMGALRAAELTDYGMIGVGQIYDAFYSGEFEDDDEVAVAHADEEQAYRAGSDAMVNIRATLLAAERACVLDATQRVALEQRAKALFYAERSWAAVLQCAAQDARTAGIAADLRAYLTNGVVDQKRRDAISMLQAVRQCCERGHSPARARFNLAHTHVWQLALNETS